MTKPVRLSRPHTEGNDRPGFLCLCHGAEIACVLHNQLAWTPWTCSARSNEWADHYGLPGALFADMHGYHFPPLEQIIQ